MHRAAAVVDADHLALAGRAALGLAHHWQRLVDEQRVASFAEIAEAEGVDVTQVRRIIRLTLLAPEVIEQLLSARSIMLEQILRRPWPCLWADQMGELLPFIHPN